MLPLLPLPVGVTAGGVTLDENAVALITESIIKQGPGVELCDALENWCTVSGIICGEQVWRSALRTFGVTGGLSAPYSTWRGAFRAVRQDVRALPAVRRPWLAAVRDWSPRQLDLAADELRLRGMPGLGWVVRQRGGDAAAARIKMSDDPDVMYQAAAVRDTDAIRARLRAGDPPADEVLHMALHRGSDSSAQENAASATIARLLLEHGANPNGNYGEMLDMAIARKNVAAIKVLLEYGAVVTKHDRDFATWRGIAAWLEQPLMAQGVARAPPGAEGAGDHRERPALALAAAAAKARGPGDGVRFKKTALSGVEGSGLVGDRLTQALEISRV